MKTIKILIVISCCFIACKNTVDKEKKSLISSEEQQTECVKMVFEKDSILGSIRNHASKKISLSQTITNYTNDLKLIDFSLCPTAFETAFDKHIDAWLKMKKVTDNYPSMRGELHAIFDQLEKSKDSVEFKSSLKQIWDTWKEVENSAKQFN